MVGRCLGWVYGTARKVWGQKIWIWVKVGHGKSRGKVSGVNGVVWMCVECFVAATRRFI